MELLFIVSVFILAGLISGFIKQRVFIESAAVISTAVGCVLSFVIAFRVAAIGTYNSTAFFSIDSLGAIVILIIGMLGLATASYSVAYFRQETKKGIVGFTRVKQYFVLLNFFMLAMFLAISASSPIFAWISIEATTLSTAFLISFYNKHSAIEAAWKYLIINSVGLLIGFFGTLLYFTAVTPLGDKGLVSWQLLLSNSGQLDPLLAKIAFIFVLIGYGTKIGFVPMHTWKPDAYSKAPAPLGALLSGALLPIAFVLVLRFKVITDATIGSAFSQQLLVIFGVLSIIVAALILYSSRNYKRLLAYSSIENAGIMALGFAFGGLGIFAATLHMIYHSCVKAVMFFSAGNLLLKYHSAKIKNVKGALNILPITSVLFIMGFLILTGTPPFGIFLTKLYILIAGFKLYPISSVVVIIFLTIVFVGFYKHVIAMFFSENTTAVAAGEDSVWLIILPTIFLIIIVILSFYVPPFLMVLINNVTLHY